MGVKSIAIEKWSAKKREEVFTWLKKNYGSQFGIEPRWYLDAQPLIEDLVMDDNVYFMFRSLWPTY